jgi:hypothetical protein
MIYVIISFSSELLLLTLQEPELQCKHHGKGHLGRWEMARWEEKVASVHNAAACLRRMYDRECTHQDVSQHSGHCDRRE